MLSKTEEIALRLMHSDLQFLYTVFSEAEKLTPSYYIAVMPYMGMIIDGCENWSNKVKSVKDYTIRFSAEEKAYYTLLRNSIKLWETPFTKLHELLAEKYQKSDIYFSNQCKTIAKSLKLYDIYGAYLINSQFCDNTILDSIFVPEFDFEQLNNADFREHIKDMAVVAGKFIKRFGISEKAPLKIEPLLSFESNDYGGFVKSPVGNDYSIRFLLFSILCTINFIVWGVDKLIIPEIPTKLRLAYVLYYYLVQQVPQINILHGTSFHIEDKWVDKKDLFRGSMAHYGLGSVLKHEEVITTDAFGGLTDKLFAEDWQSVKASIIDELCLLAQQLKVFLNL